MAKRSWPPGNLLNPVPVVLISCQGEQGPPNLLTVAWTGTVASDPPMLSISVRPERYSHHLIKETGEFVVNLPSERQVFATDYCGVTSGRNLDKWAAMRLTPEPSTIVRPPLVAECPVNLECRVDQMLTLGSHDLFLAKIVTVDVDEGLIDAKGRLDLRKAGLVTYLHGEYWSLKKPVGRFGFSVRKKRK